MRVKAQDYLQEKKKKDVALSFLESRADCLLIPSTKLSRTSVCVCGQYLLNGQNGRTRGPGGGGNTFRHIMYTI